MSQRVPRSAAFAFDVADRALGEQLARIDSLDSKAGIMLAADGVLAGLVFAGEGIVAQAPVWLALVLGAAVLCSLGCTLIAFANREYVLSLKPELVAELAAAPDDWVKWRVMGNVLRAVDTNRSRLKVKARWLAVGQASLLVTLLSLGAYFVYGLVGGL